jgi:hypothetical protein
MAKIMESANSIGDLGSNTVCILIKILLPSENFSDSRYASFAIKQEFFKATSERVI